MVARPTYDMVLVLTTHLQLIGSGNAVNGYLHRKQSTGYGPKAGNLTVDAVAAAQKNGFLLQHEHGTGLCIDYLHGYGSLIV